MTSISDTEVVNAPGGLVELGQATNAFDVAATTGTGTSIGFNLSVVCDGSPVVVEFTTSLMQHFANVSTFLVLYMDGSAVGTFANFYSGVYEEGPVTATRRLTPSAGLHTFDVRVVSGGGGTNGGIYANNGSGTNRTPHLLRVSKVIQASQLLVTQSNAPLVTQLPSGNLVDGQRVDLYANNVVYPERWNSSTSSWNVVGAPNIQQGVSNTSQTYSTASTWQNTNLSVSITPSSTTSRIMLNMSAFLSVSAAGVLGEWRIIRNGTTVVSPNRTGPATGQTINGLIADYNTNRLLNGIPFVTLDSPASTSAQTYTLQVYPNGSISVYLNRWGLDANWGATSSIIAQEIPA